MADVASAQSLSEQYLLDKQAVEAVVVEEKSSSVAVPEGIVSKSDEPTAAVVEDKVENELVDSNEEKTEDNSIVIPKDDTDTTASDSSVEDTPSSDKERDQTAEDNSGEEETPDAPNIELETAPVDFRFPTTNQTRHCFTRYVEYHRCIATKGEDASDCSKFAKYYRALCPGEWVDRWNEQRANGTFPGPL